MGITVNFIELSCGNGAITKVDRKTICYQRGLQIFNRTKESLNPQHPSALLTDKPSRYDKHRK